MWVTISRSSWASLELPLTYPDDTWHEDWKTWWDLCQDLITDDQRAEVWAILGADLPFEVIAAEVDDDE